MRLGFGGGAIGMWSGVSRIVTECFLPDKADGDSAADFDVFGDAI